MQLLNPRQLSRNAILPRVKEPPTAERSISRGRPETWLAVSLALSTVLVLLLTARDIGLTWDEPTYIVATNSYMEWVGDLLTRPAHALTYNSILSYWDINHEHPAFDKLWSGIIGVGARNFLDDLTARRLGNILLAGLLVGVLYLMVALEYGRIAGLGAVGALMTMPRFFFHAHLAALDVPVTVAMVVVCFVFWRTLYRPGLRWTLLLGLTFGVALDTKINALFELTLILGVWTILFHRRKQVFVRLALMLIIGLLVWIVLWPWLYYDTWNRLGEYVGFLTDHYKIYQWYRGRLYIPPPWHFPFAMTLAVLPLTESILCAVGGLFVIAKGRTQALGWLFIVGALVPLLIMATGISQVFDDERLFMPIFPWLAALTGLGFAQVVQWIRLLAIRLHYSNLTSPACALLACLCFLPQILSAYTYYPHLLSYYSEIFGGLPGAIRLGFETTYWAETYSEALSYLNSQAVTGATVWAEAHDVMLYYQLEGKLRSDLQIVSLDADKAIIKNTTAHKSSIKDADYAVVQYRQSGFYGDVLPWISARQPVYQLSYQQVPLLGIYER